MKRLHNYSQNFLRSPSLAKELLGHSKIKKTDTVLDIGAGSGVISSVLATRVSKVIAIEPEPKAAATLKRNLSRFDNVTIYGGDFLEMRLPQEKYSIFANIPFHISSAVIEKLIFADNPPQKIYLIVQRQFARKLESSKTHFTSQLGMLVSARYNVKIRKPLKRTDFWPHPAVDTVFLEMILKDEPLINIFDFEAYAKMTRECFSDPKKYLKLPLAKVGISPEKSPSMLTVEEWTELFKHSPYKKP